MKKLLAILVVIAAGWIGVRYLQTGSLPFASSAPASAEERQLADLEERFQQARARFGRAGRSGGLTGVDVTAEVEAAVNEVERVRVALERLGARLTAEDLRGRASALEAAIREFQRRLR